MAEDRIFFYMQRENDRVFDIESYFKGLRYSKCVGLLDKGKRKNVYTEAYADSDELRVWTGEDVTREATDITFTFYFIGDIRRAVFERFYKYISQGKVYYWDTKRLKKALLLLVDAVNVSDDMYYGSTPYIEVTIKFQNLWGECKDCDDRGAII